MASRCPYCMEEINVGDVHYFFNVGTKPSSKTLQAFLKPRGGRPEDDPFKQFWSNYHREITADELSRRIVKSRSEIDTAMAQMAARNERSADQSETENQGATMARLPGQSVDVDLSETGTDIIVCRIERKSKTADQSTQPDRYVVYEDGREIATTRPVCRQCYNILPDEIFSLPLIKVALAAAKSGGKTCMALSWFRTLDDRRGGLNRDITYMDFRSMMEENRGNDDEFNGMLEEFKQDICPSRTLQQFIPPVFFYLSFDGGKHDALVGIYDVSGEVVTNARRGNRLVEFFNHMDGIIYILEPDRTGLYVDGKNRYLAIDPDSETAFIPEARILSPQEQSRVQRDYHTQYHAEETLGDVMAGLLGENVHAGMVNRAQEVLTSLRNFVTAEQLKKMHVAIAISKCDLLRGNEDLKDYNKGNILFREDLSANQEMVRQQQLEQLFKDKIFNMDAFETTFKSWSGHMIAALGCPTETMDDRRNTSDQSEALVKPKLIGKYAPFRVEEPLLKIIQKFAEENGWTVN